MNMDFTSFLFWTLAALTGLSAVAVVVTQNIVRAAAWLLFTLAGTAGIFFLLGADFVAATQLIVYVGGVLVLVVFGVMLTAQGPFITMKTGTAEWAITAVAGLLLYGVLAVSTLLAAWPTPPDAAPADASASRSSVALGTGFLGITLATRPADLPGQPTRMEQLGPRRKRMGYLLPFEIVSVHLLVVLIGAAYLARAKRRRGAVP
jgi:NADH:ubiquinone oxidoreductase subunit 6 (subunit J)